MQVSLENLQGLQRKITVEMPADAIESRIQKKLLELSKTIRIAGFRPGKAPTQLVTQRYRKDAEEEVLSDTIKETVFASIEENNLKPASMPAVTSREYLPGQSFKYSVVIEVMPEITFNPLSGEEITKYTTELQEADINSTLEKLQQQHAEWLPVERAAQKGDKVIIDFIGTHKGVPFEGGKADNFELILGSGSMIPGFEESIYGLSPTHNKPVALTFPENYQHSDLAGKDVIFDIKLNKVFEPKLPELNDDFAKLFNQEGGLESLKSEIRKNIEKEIKQKISQLQREQVIRLLLAKNNFDTPQALIQAEIHEMQNKVLKNFKKEDREKFRGMLPQDMFLAEATQRVRVGLLFSAIIDTLKVEVDHKRLLEKIEEIASAYENPAEIAKYLHDTEQQRKNIEAQVLEDQVFDKLLEQINSRDNTMPYSEFVTFQLKKEEAVSEPVAA